ncbi:MAG: TIGR03087 family PEP-CTERM/XrtA system glycosyltransferase [Magnetococcus sp. DMHC-6]
MTDLLFLVHRIPYPPDKGDKIRSYHLLRHLAQGYRVHLGGFVDDPKDWVHEERVKNLCGGQTCLLSLHPFRAKMKSVPGLWMGDPLTLHYYRHRQLAGWVDRLLVDCPIERVVVFSSALAPLVMKPGLERMRRVVDLVDVDSSKWSQYGQRKKGLAGWIYRREGVKLLEAERRIALAFDATLLVSPTEAALFRSLAPESADKIDYWENGVDSTYFSADFAVGKGGVGNPYGLGDADSQNFVMVFTGAMDYWANIDAVCWFVRSVFFRIRERLPQARFVIVGGHPTAEVVALGKVPGVWVTGRVADIRPYVAYAQLAVAPLRIAQGVQNKILEAFAMGKPVLTTHKGMEGIRRCPQLDGLVCDDAAQMADRAVWLLENPLAAQSLGDRGRQHVEAYYNWENNLERVSQILA